MTEKQRVSEVKNFLAGGFGGICTVLSGHPFDTIKVGRAGHTCDTSHGASDAVWAVGATGVKTLLKNHGSDVSKT